MKPAKPVWLVAIAFSVSWLTTIVGIRLIWGEVLKPLNPLIWVIDFLVPLGLVLGFTIFTGSKTKRFRLLALLPALMFLLALVNIFALRSRFMNYGDMGSLSGFISHHNIFTRWILGVGLLEFLANKVIGPLFGDLNELLFVKVMSTLVMFVCSFIVLLRNPEKLRLIFVVTSPMWLLFSTGYDEYYPFIAPVFLLIMLLITDDWMNKLNPIWFGIVAGAVALSYVSFIPLVLFLMLVFAFRRGFKSGLLATGILLLTVFLAILLFYGPRLGGFLSAYRGNLNLSNGSLLQDKTFLNTPFYNFRFAFSKENLQRLFTQFFWSGSIPYFVILVVCLVFFFKRFIRVTRIKTLVFLGCVILYQVVYFFFMIPYLDTITDIDLFFSVYFSFAFSSGWMIDQLTKKQESVDQNKTRLSVLAFCVGSTSVILVYLMVLGLYQLQL